MFKKVKAGLAGLAILTLPHAGVLAQVSSAEAEPTLSAVLAKSTCLAKAGKDAGGDGPSFVVAVPQERAEDLVKRGFTPSACTGVKLLERTAKRGICDLAAARSAELNRQYWNLTSITPDEVCNLVDAVSSPQLSANAK